MFNRKRKTALGDEIPNPHIIQIRLDSRQLDYLKQPGAFITFAGSYCTQVRLVGPEMGYQEAVEYIQKFLNDQETRDKPGSAELFKDAISIARKWVGV